MNPHFATLRSKFSVLTLLFLLGLVPMGTHCQLTDEHHDHDEHDHLHTNEIGISLAAVAFNNDEPMAFGLHAHYIRQIGSSRFGVGLGVEYIFNDVKHQTYSAVFQYSPTHHLHLIAAPGVAVEVEGAHDDEHEQERESDTGETAHEIAPALHLEAVYEFGLGMFDIGPAVEFAIDPHEIHMSLGLHVAVPF